MAEPEGLSPWVCQVSAVPSTQKVRSWQGCEESHGMRQQSFTTDTTEGKRAQDGRIYCH
jgi:hypothetical protein